MLRGGGVGRIRSQPPKMLASQAGLLALLWVLLGTLGVSVSLDTNSASMPHMCELGFETPGDKV